MAQHSVLDGTFQALADPTRRAVLGRLGAGPASVGELAAPFDMALPSFMKHIRYLESTGWIRSQKVGRVRTCTLEREAFDAVESWLGEQRSIWEGRTDRLERFVTAARPGADEGHDADGHDADDPEIDTHDHHTDNRDVLS
ncbi:ArsR/SmtB family transcription factor [Promicromonospora sp. NPDC090134]|uniref:ArsR/SmtB family transcription factor n=1 Tax=Promicromonospora sp. NPDC090134 TaxID=3364408 RepID=UPI0038309D50